MQHLFNLIKHCLPFALFSNLQVLFILFVLERNLNNISNGMLDNSLVNSRVQDTGSTCSVDDIRSQLLTVHSEHDQSDVTMFEKIADVKPNISEIVNESVAGELPEDIIALRHHYNEASTMECDQSDVTILEKNENSNETKSTECGNLLMSIEVKNVFSLCQNTGDRMVCRSLNCYF